MIQLWSIFFSSGHTYILFCASPTTAPKGVEWKTWDGDKVPMKEDN